MGRLQPQPQNLTKIKVAINSTTTDFVTIVTNSLKEVTSVYPGNPGKPSLGLQYSYGTNSNGQPYADTTFPDGSKRRIVFNSSGYVIKDISNYGGTMPGPEETDYTRDLNTNLITNVEDALTRDTHYQYDSDGNITFITASYGTSNAVTTQYQYGIDAQLSQVTNGLGKIWMIGLDPTNGNVLSRDGSTSTNLVRYVLSERSDKDPDGPGSW